MPIALAVIVVLLLAVVVCAVGCTRNRPFRTSLTTGDVNDPHAVLVNAPDFKMGFVEFDDQGWFWKNEQRVTVENMILAEAGIDGQAGRQPHGIVLVAFVHGWKDNASFDGEGVKAFQQILSQLAASERAMEAKNIHPARKVVGVYAAWRGLSATWEPFKELSFWERKNTAHKVGGYGAMTELLADLENIQKKSLASLPADTPRTELIIIGHSFGAAAVYSALAQIITERFVNAQDKNKRLKPLGDQVILLNPAFEAQRHFDLNQMAVTFRNYQQDQRPVLSVFTSRGDWATHYVFPLGRFFGGIFENNRNSTQRTAGLETIGWFEPFVTHRLDYDPSATFAESAGTADANIAPTTQMLQTVEKVQAQRARWDPSADKPKTYSFDQSVLTPNDTYGPGNPFLVVSVDPSLMKDHTDIANQRMIHFLIEYIQFCHVDTKDHKF